MSKICRVTHALELNHNDDNQQLDRDYTPTDLSLP